MHSRLRFLFPFLLTQPLFETPHFFSFSLSLSSGFFRFLCLAHEKPSSLFYILSPFKLLFQNPPSLLSVWVRKKGSWLNGSQRGPWTSRLSRERERKRNPGLGPSLKSPPNFPSILLCSLRVSSHCSSPSLPSFFLSPFVDSPAVDPDERGLHWGDSCKEWESEMDNVWVGFRGTRSGRRAGAPQNKSNSDPLTQEHEHLNVAGCQCGS